MSPREEKARQLLAELAEFLRTGSVYSQVEGHLDAIIAAVRETEFQTPIDGTGELTLPLADIIQIQITPDGIGFGAPEQEGEADASY